MQNTVFLIFIILISLFILFKFFVLYITHGNQYQLKIFKNSKFFEYDFSNFKFKNYSLYNRQSLYLIFNDSSKIHLFAGIEDKSIIPAISDFCNIDENQVKAGSMHKRIEHNEFVKNFNTQSIFNVLVIDKNDNSVDYSVSKILLYEGGEGMVINLKNEKWNNIKFIKFESTTEIDATLFHCYYGY